MVESPGAEQARPTCFVDGQFQIPDRSGSDRLCSACTSLGNLESTYSDGINKFHGVTVKHHRSVSALIESARGGCHFCGLILIVLEEECRLCQEPGGGWVAKRDLKSFSLHGDITLKIRNDGITILCGDLPVHMGGGMICKSMDTVLPVLPETCLPTGSDTNTGSSASFSRIKFWLDVCISSHPACSQADFQPPPLPKRVIAVGQKGSSRCCLVSGKEKNGHYATLSHCWGDPNHRPLTTTDQTLACRQQGIENEELPKTFQHAVEVCRQIGIDYLWIDSLCIIQEQESQEDWAKEAPRMGFVYGNSTLTISAAAAADSTQGCFQERFGLFFWPCPVVMFGRACYVSRYPTYKERYYGDPGELDRSIPLFQRAWVLQEQALSRRSIIFSKNQLVWRCPTLSTNEKFPLGTPHMPSIVTDNLRLIHCIINGITSLIPKSLRFGIYTCWYKIVEDFTSRSLTYNGDRLPAIAGIAKRLGMSANDSYHAGLWRRDLIHGLLWRVTIYVKHVTRSATAPSWSWASIDCAVDYQHFSGGPHKHQRSPSSPLVDILDILDPATCEDHPFGATSKASLRLSGVLLKVVEDGHEDFELALTENGTYFRSDLEDLYLDVGEPDRTAETVLVCLPVCVRHGETHDRVSDCETYKALWKRSLETGKDEFEGKNKIYCLVLQPVEGKQDTFSRLGLCTIGRDYDIRNKITEISRIAFGERRSINII